MRDNGITEANRVLPKYPGDDTRPTSKEELAGWYFYGWAAEVFAVCGIGSFLPIALEQMARDRGVLLSDRTTPCTVTWNDPSQTSVLGGNWNLSYGAAGSGGLHSPKSDQCVIYILGAEMNTASFAMYTFSTSVLVQSILIISMSGAADHGSYRKLFLVTFAFLGSCSTMLFLSVVPKVYLLGGLFAIIANTCFGASFVLLNSFLPLLVRYHPSLLNTSDDGTPSDVDEEHPASATADMYQDTADPTSPLLQSYQAHGANSAMDQKNAALPKISKELKLSTQISSYGIGIGYIGAVILQIVSILVVIATHQTTFSLRLVLFLIGMWWFTFTIPAVLWLRPRPGPPLPLSKDGRQYRSWVGYMIYAWTSLGKTAMRARHLKDILLFLAAWFLLSDGIATVSGTAVLFAKTQLGMKPAALGAINVVAMTAGVCGAFSWSYISRLFNLQASQTIIACILLFELIPLYGLLGFVPAIKKLGFLGLQKPWEMFPLGAVYGLVMGGLSSYCRSFFGELIPPGYEAAFYSLYAITDKGSSIFGPAIVGAITDRYGEIRPAFLFLAFLIFLPLPLMLLVNVERGKQDALALATELEGKRDAYPRGYGTVPHIYLIDEEADE